MEKCEDTFVQKCTTESYQDCEVKYKNVDKTTYETKCKEVPEKKCEDTTHKVCKMVDVPECGTRYKDVTEAYTENVCKTVSVKKCKTVSREQCRDTWVDQVCTVDGEYLILQI